MRAAYQTFAWISHWRTLRIRNASNDCPKRSLTAAVNDTWQARFVWLQFIFHAFNGHTKRREPDTAQRWRSSVDYTAAAAATTATGCLCAGSRAGRSGGCFSYNNNILCSAVWLFMHLWRCLCEKLYSKPKSGWRERVVQVFALHLTVLFLPASPGA